MRSASLTIDYLLTSCAQAARRVACGLIRALKTGLVMLALALALPVTSARAEPNCASSASGASILLEVTGRDRQRLGVWKQSRRFSSARQAPFKASIPSSESRCAAILHRHNGTWPVCYCRASRHQFQSRARPHGRLGILKQTPSFINAFKAAPRSGVIFRWGNQQGR